MAIGARLIRMKRIDGRIGVLAAGATIERAEPAIVGAVLIGVLVLIQIERRAALLPLADGEDDIGIIGCGRRAATPAALAVRDGAFAAPATATAGGRLRAGKIIGPNEIHGDPRRAIDDRLAQHIDRGLDLQPRDLRDSCGWRLLFLKEKSHDPPAATPRRNACPVSAKSSISAYPR